MEDQNKEYQKGFNQGYILAKHLADLSDKLAKHISDTNMQDKGFLNGKEEYEKEKEQNRQNELQNIRNKSQTRDIERGRE